jgi:hypothetical protein
MIVKKMRQHQGKSEMKQLQGVFNASRTAVSEKPVTLAKVGGLTVEEIEAKYGPISKFKTQGQRR